MVAQRTLLIWTTTGGPQVSGYTVTPSNGGPQTAKSNMFLDATIYADDTAADAVTYSIARIDASVVTPPPTPSDYPSFEHPEQLIGRYRVDSSVRLCKLYGTLLNVSGYLENRTAVRFSPYRRDIPVVQSAFAMHTASEVQVYTNCFGEFEAWVTAGIPVVLHVPSMEFMARISVPDAVSLDLRTAQFERITPYRNN